MRPRKRTAKERGYTVAEAAIIIGIGRSLAYDLINRDEFPVPVIQIGNRTIVPKEPLDKLMATGKVA